MYARALPFAPTKKKRYNVFKHTATYKNLFDPEKIEHEDLYFHLIAPELAEFEMGFENGFREHVREVLARQVNLEIYGMFLKLISISYGRRSEDGKRFVKNPEWTKEFLASPAWEDLFFWLTEKEDGSNANTFWAGIMPDRLTEQAEKRIGKKIEDLSKEELLALLDTQAAKDVMPQLGDK